MTWAERALAGLLAMGLSFGGGMWTMSYMRDAHDNARLVTLQAAAVELKELWNADIEKRKQDQVDAVAAVRAALADDLAGLRQRAQRASDAARASCQGASGRELAAGDAEFLSRYAARVAEQQEALKTCYAWVDTVRSRERQVCGGDLLWEPQPPSIGP